MSEQVDIGYAEPATYPKASINTDWRVEQRKLTALNLAIKSSSVEDTPETILKKAKAFQKFLTP